MRFIAGRDRNVHDELDEEPDAFWLVRQAKARASAEAAMADPSWGAEDVDKAEPIGDLFAAAWQRSAMDAAFDAVEARHQRAVRLRVERAWREVSRNPESAAHVAMTLSRLERDLTDILADAVQRGAKAYAGAAPDAEFRASFRVPNHYAEAYAATRAGEYVADMGAEVVETVRLETTRSLTAGEAPAVLAQRLERTVGLGQANRDALDRRIEAMAASGSSKAVIQRAARTQAAMLRSQRAMTVARTELLKATNWGQTTAWRERARAGLVPQDARRVWLIGRDERTCPSCRQMVGDRAVTQLNVPFDTPLGAADHPPLHPRCRCSTALVTDMLTSAEVMRAASGGL